MDDEERKEMSWKSKITTRILETENDFIFIRSDFLNRPTATEQQIAIRIAKIVDS